jgi:thymidylate synthase (FAD)
MQMEHDEEIQEARSFPNTTLRPTVAAMEELLHVPHRVLDHGFLRVVDYMGDDNAVVQAARVSYGRGTKKTSEDRGLIRYLMRHWHTTPFEMCEVKLHVKLPIFVARQWIRHRTANVNEYSARYSILDREFYLPDPSHLATQSTSNRQGRDETLEGDEAAEVLRLLREDSNRSYEHYKWMLNDPEDVKADPGRRGLSRELARIGLSLATYTQWYWKVDLHNLLGFLRLRADAHAQYEIRAYAEALLGIVRKWVPMSHEAFLDYRLNGVTLSATELDVVRRALAGKELDLSESELSPREAAELRSKLELPMGHQ